MRFYLNFKTGINARLFDLPTRDTSMINLEECYEKFGTFDPKLLNDTILGFYGTDLSIEIPYKLAKKSSRFRDERILDIWVPKEFLTRFFFINYEIVETEETPKVYASWKLNKEELLEHWEEEQFPILWTSSFQEESENKDEENHFEEL